MNEKIKELQAQIAAMRDANKDAESLIEKINKDTENITKDAEGDLVKLREQIRKDIAELKSFSDPDIYRTRCIDIYDEDRDNKYGLREDTPYPVIHPKFVFGGSKEYGFIPTGGVSEPEDAAVVENSHTYCSIFRDGVFADEMDTHSVCRKDLEAFYRHWPAILVMAYEKMLKAYKDKATKDLKDALDRKSKALKRQMDIKATLLATSE